RTNTSHKLRISEGHAGLTFERRRSRAGPGGRAQPCQGWGRGFESLRPLQNLLVLQELACIWSVGPLLFLASEAPGKHGDSDFAALGMSPRKQNKAGLRIAAKAGRRLSQCRCNSLEPGRYGSVSTFRADNFAFRRCRRSIVCESTNRRSRPSISMTLL